MVFFKSYDNFEGNTCCSDGLKKVWKESVQMDAGGPHTRNAHATQCNSAHKQRKSVHHFNHSHIVTSFTFHIHSHSTFHPSGKDKKTTYTPSVYRCTPVMYTHTSIILNKYTQKTKHKLIFIYILYRCTILHLTTTCVVRTHGNTFDLDVSWVTFMFLCRHLLVAVVQCLIPRRSFYGHLGQCFTVSRRVPH